MLEFSDIEKFYDRGNRSDVALVEVLAHFFKKGEHYHDEYEFDLVFPNSEDPSTYFDDPEENTDDSRINIGTVICNQDIIGYSFTAIGTGSGEFGSGIEWLIRDCGYREVFSPYCEDLDRLAKDREEEVGDNFNVLFKEPKELRFITAWKFKVMTSIYGESDNDYELLGRIDMGSLKLK